MSMIQKALQSATIAPPREEDVPVLRKELENLTSIYNGLLPVEVRAREELRGRINTTEAKLTKAATGLELGNLSQLDPIVFTWKQPQAVPSRKFIKKMQVPVFAYIPVDSESCRLSISRYGSATIDRNYPKAVRRAYESMLDVVSDQFLDYNHDTVSLTYRYPGAIPEHVREIITREKTGVLNPKRVSVSGKPVYDTRFDQLAFVCEVPQWECTWSRRSAIDFLDPILVGVKSEAFWILSTFDPTPVEQYLADEFAKRNS